MTRSTDMLATLRTLDPADPNVDPRNPRAHATLARILSTDPGPRPIKARPRRGIRLAVVASATAIAAAVTVVVVPSLTNGDRAFASWTATPGGLSAQAAADAAADCRNEQFDGPGAEYGDKLRLAAVAIAERRGEWTLVVLSGSDGFSALCITDNASGLFRDWFGSVGMPANYAAPGPRDVVATDLGTGSASAGELSAAAGYVGSDVAGIAYQSVSHGEVVATVSAGRFALWLPGDELEYASRDGVRVDVTYRDGTTGTVRIDLQ